jgi:protease I
MVIAHQGFRDEELLKPKEILESRGAEVLLFSTQKGEAKGKLGAEVQVDGTLDQMDVDDLDALLFVGGPGSSQFFHDPTAHRLLQEAEKKKKVVGSICSAGATLAYAGVLKGKKATSFHTERGDLEKNGAIYLDEPVVVEGKIVTANGPHAAAAYGEALVKLLEQ